MRVGVLRTQVPFVSGGAERHAAGLVAALQRHGHEAAEITLPFKWYPGDVLAEMFEDYPADAKDKITRRTVAELYAL